MDHSVFDAGETVVESFARGLACVDRTGEALVDVVVAELLELFLVTAPESFEHHTVGSLTAFEESQEIEAPVGSEEHTSELQSRENLVCRLLLEKKKTR